MKKIGKKSKKGLIFFIFWTNHQYFSTADFMHRRCTAAFDGHMLDSLFNDVESYGRWAMLALSVVLTGLALGVAKYIIARPWFRFVKSTEAEWDDLMYFPFLHRLYLLVLVGSLHLSLRWIYGGDSDFMVSLTPIFSATYIFIGTTIASVLVYYLTPVLIERFSQKSSVTVSDGSHPLISFMLRGIIWFTGLLLALNELEIELVGLFASLAVFSLILGFAMQQSIGNIMNSFMLAIDRPFEVGDRIEVENILGTVVSIGVLSTKILTREEKLVIIPNNTLVSSTLVNHARGGGDGMAHRISLVLDIGVDYREDISHVKYILFNVAKDCPYVIKVPKPRVLLTDLGDYSKMFKLFSWVKDYTDELTARDWLLREIDERFSNENIVIPYPIAIKLDELQSDTDKDKTSRQLAAKKKMTKVDKKQRKERKISKSRIDEIRELLRNPDLDNDKVAELKEELQSLERSLAMFDLDVD